MRSSCVLTAGLLGKPVSSLEMYAEATWAASEEPWRLHTNRSLWIIPTPLHPCICRELVSEHSAAATCEGYQTPRNSRCVKLDCWSLSLAGGICHTKAVFT